jgi:hypothetical protein
MISTIKGTSLYAHMMQWGIPGFSDAMLTYIENSNTDSNSEDSYKSIAKDIMSRFPQGTSTYVEERILE